jgi:hypothetical protein
MRVCSACKQPKPLDQFCRNGAGRRHSWCDACRSEDKRKRYQEKREAKGSPKARNVKRKPSVPSSSGDSLASPEPAAKNPPAIAHEPDKFRFWERAYGRALSDTERLEIQSNLRRFFAILLDPELSTHGRSDG